MSAQQPDVPAGCHLISFDSVGSTNEEAKKLAQSGAEAGTVVWARQQTAGRGRHGRSWASPPGNLYLSVIQRPDCHPADAPQLGFVTGVAKWPESITDYFIDGCCIRNRFTLWRRPGLG